MNKEEIVQLVVKHLRGELTFDENRELQLWLSESAENRQFFDNITKKDQLHGDLGELNEYEAEAQSKWEKLEEMGLPKDRKVVRMFSPAYWKHAIAVAVMIAGVILVAFYWLDMRSKNATTAEKMEVDSIDLVPGGNKATLTLGNGKTIVLDDVRLGRLASEDHTDIQKIDSGHLSYVAKAPSENVTFNVVSTPRGGQFKVTLPDGSIIWLNSESSVRFPVAFSTGERRIEVTGEVYCDVTHDAEKPFRVTVGRSTISVLGTTFNINAYKNESSLRATLITGAIQLNAAGDSKDYRLAPGQQANVPFEDGKSINIRTIKNTDRIIAWKNGYFVFDGDDLPSIMRQLSRWYDLKVVYKGEIPAIEFSGKLSKNTNATNILAVLENMGVKFNLDGHTITVYR